MATRNYSNTSTLATTTAFLDATTTSMSLNNFGGFPVAPFIATMARGTVDEENVLVTAVAGTSVTFTRGYDGTTAKSHAAGTAFQHVATAMDFAEANAHVNATGSVHGVTGSLVGTTAVQTLTNKTLTSPAITGGSYTGTQSFQAATVATLAVTGSATVPTATLDTQAVNRGQVNSLAAALDVAQVTPGTTRSTGGYVTAATGWTVNSYTVRCVGSGWLYYNVVFTRSGAAVTFSATTGNMGNQTIAGFHSALAPLAASPANSMETGRQASGNLNTTPNLVLTSVGGTDSIATGQQLQLAGYAKLADPGSALALLG